MSPMSAEATVVRNHLSLPFIPSARAPELAADLQEHEEQPDRHADAGQQIEQQQPALAHPEEQPCVVGSRRWAISAAIAKPELMPPRVKFIAAVFKEIEDRAVDWAVGLLIASF